MDSSEIETVSEILQNFDWFRRHLLLIASSPRGGSTFTAEVIGREGASSTLASTEYPHT